MKLTMKRSIATLVAGVLIIGSFAGCGSKTADDKGATSNATERTQVDASKSVYPISKKVTLKYWAPLNSNVSPIAKNLGDTPLGKELEKRTGVKLEFLHPAVGQDKEVFNLLIASGDLPDLVEFDILNSYPGGPENAIGQGNIIKLNDTIDKYAPNLKKLLSENPIWDKTVKTDSGSYYQFPFIRGDDVLRVYFGPIIRKDWLDELGMQVPTTIDEWYTVLKAFKEKKNAEAPLAFQGSPFHTFNNEINGNAVFAGAFGVRGGFYNESGEIKFGPIQPGYKEYLKTLRKWYSEGLLDKNFASVDGKALDASMTGGKAGASAKSSGSWLGKWMNAMKDKDPKYNLVAAPYPTLKKGDKPKFGQLDNIFNSGHSVAITTKCKEVEIAARFLDYGYSKEGAMLYNFGIEGESYKMENGAPKYTDLVLNNPDKLPLGQAMAKYMRSIYGGPFIQNKDYITQYMQLPQQKEAIKVWSGTDAVKHVLPQITPTSEESSQYAKVMNDVNTYVDEMFVKFVMGIEPIESFDKYVEQVKKLNIEKAISINKAALDRFNKR